MKISVIGAGNVGSLAAMRINQESLGEVVLIDVVKGLAAGKAMDIEDSRVLVKAGPAVKGSDDICRASDSDIVVITAGLARKPGMTREELQNKNAAILKDICHSIKKLAPESIVVVVTNPLDIMTYYALKLTGFKPNKLFGMGISLDSARFANMISNELGVSPLDVEALVLGSHGEGMLPMARLSRLRGVSLDKLIDSQKLEELAQRTVNRGAEIVSLLGSGSAFFAPSAAIAAIVRALAKDEKRIIGVCAALNGEYGIKDSCIGVPCRLGACGIEQIIELELTDQETGILAACADSVRQRASQLPY